jgi:hypothetical protein
VKRHEAKQQKVLKKELKIVKPSEDKHYDATGNKINK